MDQKIKDRIAETEARANAAALAWLKENEPNIPQLVRATLDRRVEQIVMALLGFNKRYSDDDYWEVDHCNNRSGDSAAGDWLRQRAGGAVKIWLDKQVGKLPELSVRSVASLRAEYAKELEQGVRQMLHERAVESARAEVQRVCSL